MGPDAKLQETVQSNVKTAQESLDVLVKVIDELAYAVEKLNWVNPLFKGANTPAICLGEEVEVPYSLLTETRSVINGIHNAQDSIRVITNHISTNL